MKPMAIMANYDTDLTKKLLNWSNSNPNAVIDPRTIVIDVTQNNGHGYLILYTFWYSD